MNSMEKGRYDIEVSNGQRRYRAISPDIAFANFDGKYLCQSDSLHICDTSINVIGKTLVHSEGIIVVNAYGNIPTPDGSLKAIVKELRSCDYTITEQ